MDKRETTEHRDASHLGHHANINNSNQHENKHANKYTAIFTFAMSALQQIHNTCRGHYLFEDVLVAGQLRSSEEVSDHAEVQDHGADGHANTVSRLMKQYHYHQHPILKPGSHSHMMG